MPEERAERLAAALADYCMDAGDRDGLYILTQSEVNLRLWNSSNYSGNEEYHLVLRLPAAILRAIGEEKQVLAERLFEYTAEWREFEPDCYLDKIHIQISLQDRPDWKESAEAFLKGQGVSNQGRVRSDNPAPYEHHGLFFRSKAEILLCEALRTSEIPFAPLAVFLRGDGAIDG